jgi:hypothetical protein
MLIAGIYLASALPQENAVIGRNASQQFFSKRKETAKIFMFLRFGNMNRRTG